MKKKTTIISIIILLLILGGLYIAYEKDYMSEPKEQQNQENENNEIIQNITQDEEEINANAEPQKVIKLEGTKMVNDIEISNIKITQIENQKCEFTADVKNTTDKYLKTTNLRIKIIDENGEVDEIFGGGITELAAYEPNTFKTIALADITDAKDVIFEVIN